MKVHVIWIVLVLNLFAPGSNGAVNCGEKKAVVQQLIRRGHQSLAGAWPWHGAMFHRHKRSAVYACGVTILTEKFVVTAAHCTIDPEERQGIPADRVYIKVGITNLELADQHLQQHDVSKIIRHEDYNDETSEDDIALLKLQTEIEYNNYVQPICLWQGDSKLSAIVAKIGYIAGLDENYGLSMDLNEASMAIVSRRECINSDRDHYSKFYFETKTFCAGYGNGTQAAPGTSGGGLYLRIGQNWFLRGILSSSKVDPHTLKVDASSFSVFTDTAYYVDWIKSKVT